MYRKLLRMIILAWNIHVVCTHNPKAFHVIHSCYLATVRHRPSLEFDERSVRHHITNFYKQNKWKPGASDVYVYCMYVLAIEIKHGVQYIDIFTYLPYGSKFSWSKNFVKTPNLCKS